MHGINKAASNVHFKLFKILAMQKCSLNAVLRVVFLRLTKSCIIRLTKGYLMYQNKKDWKVAFTKFKYRDQSRYWKSSDLKETIRRWSDENSNWITGR